MINTRLSSVSLFDSFLSCAQQSDVAARTALIDVGPSLQAAIDIVSAAGGGTIMLPSGRYLIGNQGGAGYGLMLKSGVSLIGSGIGATELVLAPTANAHLIQIDRDAENVRLSAMTIDGNAAGQTLNVHGILARGMNGATFTDLLVRNTKFYGIGIQNYSNQVVVLDRIHFQDTGANGLDIKNKSNGNDAIIVSNIIVERFGLNTIETEKAGVTMRGPGIFSSIIVRDYGAVGTEGKTGIRFRDGETSQTNGGGGHYSSLTGFVCRASTKDNYSIGVEMLGRNCSVSGGTVRGCATGVRVSQRGNAVSATTVDDCTVGVDLLPITGFTTRPDYNALSAITVRNCGIGVKFAGAKSVLSGAVVTDCTTAILATAASSGNVATGALLSGNATDIADLGVGNAFAPAS